MGLGIPSLLIKVYQLVSQDFYLAHKVYSFQSYPHAFFGVIISLVKKAKFHIIS